MRRISPRRDAIEYGILLTMGTTFMVGYGALLYARMTPDSEGKRRKFGLDPTRPLGVDIRRDWKEAKEDFLSSLSSWNSNNNNNNNNKSSNSGSLKQRNNSGSGNLAAAAAAASSSSSSSSSS